ncbi:unnamed protein product [Closterium sp. NIES-53]
MVSRAGPSSGPPSRFRIMGPPLANVQLASSPLLSRPRQIGHVATNRKQAATTSAARFALVVSIPVFCPVARHGFVPRSARGERATYRGVRASSAQPVTRPVTQQHAQPRVAAACTPARVAVALASSSSTHSSAHSSSGERKYMCTCSSRQRAQQDAHAQQQLVREHTRRTCSLCRCRYAPSLSLPRLLAWGGKGEGVTGVTSKPPPAALLPSFLSL